MKSEINKPRGVYLLYRCDALHSWDSMELMGIFTELWRLKIFLGRMKFRKKLSQGDYDELLSGGQTQNLETNYFMEMKEVNPNFDKICKL